MSNYIKILPIALFILTGLASADQMTYTIAGTGSGYFGSRQFTNAAFTFTELADVSTISQGTPCCAAVYTTHSSSSTLWAAVAGFTAAQAVTGTVFINQATNTAGLWQENSPEFLTVANPVFANYNLSTNIGPVSGTTWAYAAPLELGTGQQLYFTSVSGVTFTAHRSGNYGELSNVSMTPASGNATIGAPQTYSFVFADTLGAADFQGVDILFGDPGVAPGSPGSDPDACWVYLNLAGQSLSVFKNPKWSVPVALGGSTLTGDECVVNTQGASFSLNQTQITVTLPITLTPNQNITSTWTVRAAAFDQDATTDYGQIGTVTVSPPVQPGFNVTITPTGPQALVLSSTPSTISYTLNVVPSGGFNGTVSFLPLIVQNQDPHLSYNFNPQTVTGAGSTTLTVSTTAATIPGSTYIPIIPESTTGVSGGGPVQTGNIYVVNAAPTVAVSPNAGSTATQLITVNATDPADARDVNGVDMLIAPTLDGQHACWVFYDGTGLWLATDDAASWMYAGAIGSSISASNSQCTIGGTIGGSKSFVTPSPIQTPPVQTLSIAIPVTFQPSFAGGKTVFVRASNLAKFDSGYQSVGTWSVP